MELTNFNLFKSVSIRIIRKYDNRRKNTTVNDLSKIVQQSNLRNIYFNIENNRISNIEWPINCSIECLTLNEDMAFDNLVKIFSCSPQLPRLILKEKLSSIIDHYILTSSFLLLTPSLTYLK